MAYCKKFIDGINAINFSEKSVGIVKNALIAYTYQELAEESKAIEARLEHLPESIEGNESANEQLALYKEKQQKINLDIKARMLGLQESVKVNLDEPIVLGDIAVFISEFSQNFRNIRHLADTLSDAPAAVKKLQTNLYVEMLAKLGQAEQEEQLQTLSLDNIKDMIEQATLMYENKPDDVQLRNQCQRLAQMGFYEMVRRDCAKVEVAESAQYAQYQEVLSGLRTKLPNVKTSAIIDNLSQYKDSNGHSVADLLADVEGKLKITQKGDWDKAAKISMVKERKALFDQLRFGQEDRREYARKIQGNLTRDLFWARNIRDVELFTKSTTSDEVFTSLAEGRLLKKASKSTFKFQQAKHKSADLVLKKLEEGLAGVWDARKGLGIKTGNSIEKFTETGLRNDKTLIKECVKDIFAGHAGTPTVQVSPNGKITVNLYYFDMKPAFLDAIYNVIKKNGGFGRDFRPMFASFTGLTDITDHLHRQSITGDSVEDIQRQLTRLDVDGEEALAYQTALDLIKDSIPEKSVKISKAGLGDGELLLRKLLELQSICGVKAVQDAINAPTPLVKSETLLELEEAFKLVAAGKYKAALEVPGIAASTEDAYTKIALLDERELDKRVAPIVSKAKIMTASAQERREKVRQLEEAFQSEEDVAAKVEAVFLAEYEAMAPTLKLDVLGIERMKAEIKGMAIDTVRLIERTRKGEPAITKSEQDAYFSIVQKIADAIKPTDIIDVRFKVKHSATGPITIQVLNSAGEPVEGSPVAVNLGSTKLPYSLVKPPGGEFIFPTVVVGV
ncbi:hypothetical protein [Legionella tunisiensis]|uniref:hypothetical protein n=1 Tax=Legionella tunisiensis TaxID=1034944 RepID=UPI0002E8073B|nr:hypothetical protein [Legionella tunisiensis]